MKMNKLLILLLSILVAFALWMYVITIVSPESEETFTGVVKLEGLQKDLMLTDDAAPAATVTVKGNRTDLAKLSGTELVLKADLSKIIEPGVYDVTYNLVTPGDIPSGSLTVQTRDPGTVSVTVERKVIDRPIEVKVEDNDTNVKSGHTVHELKLDAEQILVTGPESVIDKIAYAKVELDLTDKDKSFGEERPVTLCDEDGNPVDDSRVEYGKTLYVTTVIHQVKELKLDVKVVYGGGATAKTSQITKSLETISVHGLADDLKKLDELLENGVLYLGTVNLAEVEADTPVDEPLEFDIIKKLPEGVEVQGDTEKLTVSVHFPDLQIVELMVTEFELKNVAEGMDAQCLTKELKVRIRGPKEAMETLTADKVKLVLDFAGAKTGNSKLAPQVVITGAEYKGAGALGTYEVDVSLEKK